MVLAEGYPSRLEAEPPPSWCTFGVGAEYEGVLLVPSPAVGGAVDAAAAPGTGLDMNSTV